VAEGSVFKGLGKVVLGGAVGFGLYMLITGLGFGGLGGGADRGRGEARPRDDARLNFLLFSKGLELRGADWKPTPMTKIYVLEEAIARVKDGGRLDIGLKISGDVRQGDVVAVLAAFKRAGIAVWKTEASSVPARVSGNARGEYGTRFVPRREALA